MPVVILSPCCDLNLKWPDEWAAGSDPCSPYVLAFHLYSTTYVTNPQKQIPKRSYGVVVSQTPLARIILLGYLRVGEG